VGFPLGAGVIFLAAAYVVVNLMKFTINCAEAEPQLRFEADQGRQGSLIAAAQNNTTKNWLRQQLGRAEFRVCLGTVFGSVTRAYPTRDVDVVVRFEPASEYEIRKLNLRLKELNRAFETEFDPSLHLQLFVPKPGIEFQSRYWYKG
jgi:predicted nucleotidyltransferase